MMYVLAYRAQGQSGRWRAEMSVKETIEIIALQRDVSMSTPGNVTSLSSPPTPSPAHMSLLWVPYVLIALVFIVFLGANFWCYHKKHRERYLRKRDEKRVKDGLHERRRITALMRSHFQSAFMSKNNVEEFVDEEDNVSVAESATSMSLPNSGVSISEEGSKPCRGQSWTPTNRLSPVQPSSAVEGVSAVTSQSAHKLFSGRSVSTPDCLPPGQIWSSDRSSPGLVASPDRFVDRLSPAQSLSPNRMSPDQSWSGPERLSAVLLRTLPDKLSLGSPLSPPDQLPVVYDKLSPGQTLFPSSKLSSDKSLSPLDRQSPVYTPSPMDKLSSLVTSSDYNPPSRQSLSPDKLSPGRVSTLSDKLPLGDHLSANRVSSSPTLPSNKLSPSQTWPSSGHLPAENQRPWTNHNGSCRSDMNEDDGTCNVKRETSNGSVVH